MRFVAKFFNSSLSRISSRGKLNKTDQAAQRICNYELKSTFRRKKTSSSNYWNSNNNPTLLCSKYWNL